MSDLHTDVPHELTMLADWLTEGKPELGWRGDPRLDLRIGVVIADKDGYKGGKFYSKGQVVGRCLEVHRWTEQGKDERILQRRMDQWHTVIPKLVELDPRTPGFVDAFTRVERANEIEHKHAADAVAEAKGEAIEHLWSIVQEREHGRLTHRQVGGSDERVDRNLAKQ